MKLNEINNDTIEIFNDVNLWIPKQSESYEVWLTKLCTKLIKSGFLNDELCYICLDLFEKIVIMVYFGFFFL